MRIVMRVQITGTRNGADWPAPGGVIDLPSEEAAALCASGLAETAKGHEETSTPAATETATPKRRRKA